jgi:Rrf2 family iron-sulfur cluster assembly transcriptional regulator
MLSKTARDVLKAMVELAELPPESYAGAASVAERIGAPRNYLAKQLKQLARLGLVSSQKGLGGGFRLARPAKEITLFEVVEPLDNVSRMRGCFFGGSCDCQSSCAVHGRWAKVRQAFLDFLNQTMIADLASFDMTLR